MTATLEDVKSLAISKWGTLNTAASPTRLPEGHSPNNQNVWMDEKPGSVVTANGYIKLGTSPSNLPTTFLCNFFKTSDGSQSVVLSDGMTVWKTTDYVNFTVVKTGLSPFFQLRGLVIRGKLWLTNGSDDVMTYDGATLATLDGSGGTPDVPLGKYIAYHDERVWLYGINGDPSSLRFSDLADSSGVEIAPDNSAAWPSDNEIQISEGDDDIGTALFLYRGYLYGAKAFSIWRIIGYDEYTYDRVKTRSSTGTRFQESVKEMDNLVHLLGVDGLYTFDGEDSTRISDIIDPASSDEGVFAFRNLQQPLLNTTFWNVSQTADFAAGTVPAVLSTADDKLTLVPADDTQGDFNAGTKTRVTADDNAGFLQLALVATGSAGTLISTGKTASMLSDGASGSIIGLASYITDGNETNYAGILANQTQGMRWIIDLGSARVVSRAIIRKFYGERNASSQGGLSTGNTFIQYSNDNVTWTTIGTAIIPANSSGTGFFHSGTQTIIAASDITVNFASTSARYWRFIATVQGGAYYVLKELEIYKAGFEADGKFVSKTIDYTYPPASYGALAASIVTSSENYQFFTQASSDGSVWDAEVNVANNAAIGSTLKRYLRWGVYLYSSTGVSSGIIDKVFVGGTYVSEVHSTGGGIFQWGAFQAALNKLGQTINIYYRAGSTSGATLAASWTAIIPGAIPSTAITNTFIQIRVEFSTTDATLAPNLPSFTVNWVVGTGAGVNTLQNVAAFAWLNRYWLSAATLGAAANDIVIVRGKSTFGSPWHKKDFSFLSFARFQDYFIAGSSLDGSIYRLETGFSKAGAAMDSFFETADFAGDNSFFRKFCEILINLDRAGPYSLSFGYSTDGGIAWTEKLIDLTRASLAQSLTFVKKLNISFMADQVRFRFRINAIDQPFSVDSFDAFYRPTTFRGPLGG